MVVTNIFYFSQNVSKIMFLRALKLRIVWQWFLLTNQNFFRLALKFKEFADIIVRTTQNLKFLSQSVENNNGNREKDSNQQPYFLLIPVFSKYLYFKSTNKHFLLFKQCFPTVSIFQIFGRKFCKNTKKSSIYSQSLLIFIHRTPAVKDI